MKSNQDASPSAEEGFLPPAKPMNKTRRLLLKLMGIGGTLAGTKGFGQFICPESDDMRLRNNTRRVYDADLVLYRPQDLLFLRISFVNFEIRNDKKLHRKSSGSAYAIISFQSQSIAETAYPEGTSANFPAQAFASEESRLVYEVPSSVNTLELTADSLLAFSKWRLVVNKRASAPNIRIQWTADDEKPVILNPIRQLPVQQRPQADTVKTPVRINNRAVNNQPVNQPSTSRPVRIMQNVPAVDTPKTRLANINQANRIANKNEQQQIAVTQLPQREQERMERANNAGAVNVIANLIGGKSPRPLDDLETAIEMPWRLFLSPSGMHTFAHDTRLKLFELIKTAPIQVYELWHTRMALLKNGIIDESDVSRKLLTMRAMWGVDICADPKNKDSVPASPLLTSMDGKDRHRIVHESSNWSIRNFTPQPIYINRMMMSTLGAWLDSNFEVTEEELAKGIIDGGDAYHKGLNLLKWSHLATMGRDHYVEIVSGGNILPFGNKAVSVKITERKPEGGFALNRQREFIIITEPEKTFMPRSKADAFLSFPFRTIKIHTLLTPTLSAKQQFVKTSSSAMSNEYQYVIRVNNQPFPFKMSAIDSEGNEIDFEMPLVFVSADVTGKPNKSELEDIIEEYNKASASWSGGIVAKGAALKNQSFALADSLVPGDTSFEADYISFACQYLEDEFHAFYPKLSSAKIYEPSTQAITGIRNASPVTLRDDKKGTAQVYAEFGFKAAISFGGNTDKTGGGLAPNFALSGLSKIQGAFGGDVNKMVNFTSDASSFFGSSGAEMPMLFGCVDLTKLVKLTPPSVTALINSVNSLKNQVADIQNKINKAKELEQSTTALQAQLKNLNDQLISSLKNYSSAFPALKQFKLPTADCVQYNWYPDLQKSFPANFNLGGVLQMNFTTPPPAPAGLPGAANKNIYVSTLIKKPNQEGGGGAPQFSTEAAVQSFNIVLANIIKVGFKKVAFKVSQNAKVDISVDMEKPATTFLGPLSFINEISKVIPDDGFSDPPFLDVTAEGVKTGYTLAIPDLSVGAFMLRNLSLGAMVNLPFTGAPMTLRFNFCERHQPFTLTVSALGGGGFFGIELDLKGLRTLEASLEFGAAVSLNLGVASGAVSIMGGIYFKMKFESGNSVTELTGYVRINGAMSVLGLITASLEFYLGLTYNMDTGKAWGEASLKIKIEILFFSKTVSITTRREFKGSSGDPTFAMLMPPSEWNVYCDAFAA
jgi:hypothetical protein